MDNLPGLPVVSASASPAPAYDTPWKIAIEQHFQAFMAFYFPAVHDQIDWSVKHEFLDKELQAIARDALVGTRHVDKLVKVKRTSGVEDWLCIHIEIQVSQQAKFAERMFVYHYRLFDLYGKPAASLALLGDNSLSWLPQQYGHDVMGCSLDFRFPMVKLLQFAKQEDELASAANPFALLTLAYLKNRATANDMNQRYDVKCELIRLLYARQWDAATIRQFFLVIDWMMALPPALTSKLTTFISELEQERRMEYVSSVERLRSAQQFDAGKAEMLRRLLTRRFGNLPEAVQAQLVGASTAQIEVWFDLGLAARTLDEVFQGQAH